MEVGGYRIMLGLSALFDIGAGRHCNSRYTNKGLVSVFVMWMKKVDTETTRGSGGGR